MPQEVYNIVVNVAVSVWLSILNDFTIISKTCKGFSVGCFTQTFILPCFYTHAHKYIYSMLYIHICVIYVHICPRNSIKIYKMEFHWLLHTAKLF